MANFEFHNSASRSIPAVFDYSNADRYSDCLFYRTKANRYVFLLLSHSIISMRPKLQKGILYHTYSESIIKNNRHIPTVETDLLKNG